MATQNDYDFGTAGVVNIGGTPLNNVTRAQVTWEVDRAENRRFSAGDTRAKVVRGPGTVTCTVVLEMYDETGIVGTLNQFAIGDETSGEGKTMNIMPDGSAAGKKQLILTPPAGFYGMDLLNKEYDAPATEDAEPVTGSMTWIGIYDEEVLFTAIPA